MSVFSSRSPQAILVGSIVGGLLTSTAQSLLPLTIFLYPSEGLNFPENVSSLLIGNPVITLAAYLAIPVIAGSITGLLDRENPLIAGLLSGLASGLVNLAISVFYTTQLREIFLNPNTSVSFSSWFQTQFFLLTFLLTLLWGLIAAFSAKACAWSFEKRANPPVSIGAGSKDINRTAECSSWSAFIGFLLSG